MITQLYPAGKESFLPATVQLNLLSKAREKDNYIQLKPFKGKLRKLFSIEIALEGRKVGEDFKL